MTLTRRRFLRLTVTGTLASLASAACDIGDGEERALAQPEVLDILGPDRVREIGAQYRMANPRESTASALRAAIQHARRPWFPFPPRPSLAQQVRDDFASGRTVLVGGWLLSATEARQCALFSLGGT